MPSPDPTVADWIASGETTLGPADAEVWSYTFGERGPDFVLTIRGETIGRVYLCTTRPGGYVWLWSILCSFRWGHFDKPPVRLNGDAPTKAGAIEGLRASWAIERDWRRKAREITATTHGCWSPWMLEAVWKGHEPEGWSAFAWVGKTA